MKPFGSNQLVKIMKTLSLTSFLLALLASGLSSTRGADATPVGENKEQRDQRMGWFRDSRFGMFIHWGLYALPGGEWNGKQVEGIGEWIMNNGHIPVADYEKLASQFNPVKFNATQWVNIANDAGVRYIVITSKHHDGFSM